MPNAPAFARSACALIFAVLGQACASGTRIERPASPAPVAPSAVSLSSLGRVPTDPLAAYRKAGFLVGGEPFPLVGMVHALASPSPESTLILVTVSLPNRVLTFTRDGEQYHATYDV